MSVQEVSQFLSPHLLLFALNKNAAKDSAALQEGIKSKLLISQKALQSKLEEKSAADAKKLVDLLSNDAELKKLREEHRFTLESLKKEYRVTVDDCQNLQVHAKILFEAGKYKEAEKYLYHLKEILTNEQQASSALMLDVFWGLLACQIINGKGRDVVEHTSLKKMRELLEKKSGSWEGSADVSPTLTWLLHWLLVYSFTSKDLANNGLFATLLTDSVNYGSIFLKVVSSRAGSLLKFMVSSFLLAQSQAGSKYQVKSKALEEFALPLALDQLKKQQGTSAKADPFCLLLKAIYEDLDMEKALKLVDDVMKEVNGNFLLKPYAADIKKQISVLILSMKCRIFKTVSAAEVKASLGVTPAEACGEIEKHIPGFVVVADTQAITCKIDGDLDSRKVLEKKAMELFERTKELNLAYVEHAQKMK